MSFETLQKEFGNYMTMLLERTHRNALSILFLAKRREQQYEVSLIVKPLNQILITFIRIE
jgi:hypothetical protein